MSAIELNTDRLVADLKHVEERAEDLLDATKDAVGDKVQEVRRRLADSLNSARHTCRRLEGKAREGAKVADRTIRDHPYESIGVAFGLGLLIGALVIRK